MGWLVLLSRCKLSLWLYSSSPWTDRKLYADTDHVNFLFAKPIAPYTLLFLKRASGTTPAPCLFTSPVGCVTWTRAALLTCPQVLLGTLGVSGFQPPTLGPHWLLFQPHAWKADSLIPRDAEVQRTWTQTWKTKPCFCLCTRMGVNDRNMSQKINSNC